MMFRGFLLLLITFQAHAFINIEEVRRQAGPGFVGKSSATLNGQKGNTEKFGIGVSTLNIYRFTENEYLALGDYNVSETFGNSDTNNGRLHLRYTIYPENRFSLEVFGQTEFDQFKQIQNRDLIGANLRQRLSKDQKESFYAGYGTFFEYQLWNDDRVFKVLRANLYLSYVKQFDDHWSVFSVMYLQPSWTAFSDFRFELQSGVNTTITEKLSLTAQLSVETDTKRAPGVKPTDMTYQSGLMLKY